MSDTSTELAFSQDELRFLAALFLRSHMAQRRRRHPEGYLMGELDGCVLSASEIFSVYPKLTRHGLVSSTVVDNGQVVFKLTQAGSEYVADTIYPSLFVSDSPELADGKTLSLDPNEASDRLIDTLRGHSINQIWELAKKDANFFEKLDLGTGLAGELGQSAREEIRKALFRISSEIEGSELIGNSDRSQIETDLTIVAFMLDAPSCDKKDVGRFLLRVLDKTLQHGLPAATLVLAVLAYLRTI